MKKLQALGLVAAALLLACVAFGAFRLGQMHAHREALRELAFVSLWTVKPSVQLVDVALTQPGAVPDAVLLAAESAIYMVARQSMDFDPDLSQLHHDAQNILCALAKNRVLYHDRQPGLYDGALMKHLAQVHETLASSVAEPQSFNGQSGCAV